MGLQNLQFLRNNGIVSNVISTALAGNVRRFHLYIPVVSDEEI